MRLVPGPRSGRVGGFVRCAACGEGAGPRAPFRCSSSRPSAGRTPRSPHRRDARHGPLPGVSRETVRIRHRASTGCAARIVFTRAHGCLFQRLLCILIPAGFQALDGAQQRVNLTGIHPGNALRPGSCSRRWGSPPSRASVGVQPPHLHLYTDAGNPNSHNAPGELREGAQTVFHPGQGNKKSRGRDQSPPGTPPGRPARQPRPISPIPGLQVPLKFHPWCTAVQRHHLGLNQMC